MHQLAVLNLFLSWSDPQMLGWGERSRALQTLFLSKDGESCFPKLLLHATTRPNLTPFCCPSYAKHTIFYFWYFSQTTKIQKFDTQACVRLLVSANEWEKWASNGWVMSEWKKTGILLTNTTVFSPTWHIRMRYSKTLLTGYTYMYLSPSQLPCVLHITFLDKLSLLSWSLEQATKILECVSCCKLQTLWWLKNLIQEMPIVWKIKS